MKKVESYLSIKNENEINLSSNESYLGINDELFVMMKSAASKVNLNRYPKVEDEEIKERYATYIGKTVTKENIIVGNGSDEMLGLIISSAISYGKKALLLSTDFGMFDYYISVNGGDIVKYKTSDDKYIDVDDFINYGKREKIDLIVFSNPNNPTGNVLSREMIIKILKSFPNIYVVIDEAYYEFYGESMVGDINEFNNLIVTRTLSKAWGLAALRVGFLISNKENVTKLEKYKVPYTISALSEAMVKVALKNINRVKEDSKKIVEAREKLYEDLKEIENEAVLEIKFFKSNANFIFGRTPYKEALLRGLKLYGISIRNFKDDSFRITVGSPFENKRLLESIKSVFVYGGQ